MQHLPDGATVRLFDYCKSISDGDHQAPPKSAAGIPFITISALNDGRLHLSKATRFVPLSYYRGLHPARRAKEAGVWRFWMGDRDTFAGMGLTPIGS
jgi:hypothetical protein